MLFPLSHFVFSDAVFGPTPPITATPSGTSGSPCAVVCHRVRPSPIQDLQSVVDTIERRALARRSAVSEGEDPSPDATVRARLSQLANAAPVADQSPSRSVGSRPASPGAAKKPLAARGAGGFDVHAEVVIQAHARGAIERLLRYLARPPVASDRPGAVVVARRDDNRKRCSSELPTGHIAVDLKRTWKNGVRTLTFTPLAFMARLAALVPPPRMHPVSYFGVIAPHAALRTAVPSEQASSRSLRPTAALTRSRRPGQRGCCGRICSAECFG